MKKPLLLNLKIGKISKNFKNSMLVEKTFMIIYRRRKIKGRIIDIIKINSFLKINPTKKLKRINEIGNELIFYR